GTGTALTDIFLHQCVVRPELEWDRMPLFVICRWCHQPANHKAFFVINTVKKSIGFSFNAEIMICRLFPDATIFSLQFGKGVSTFSSIRLRELSDFDKGTVKRNELFRFRFESRDILTGKDLLVK